MKKILIVKFWALGDILMATPLLRALKRGMPDCHITWIADKDYAGILENNPFIDELIPYDSGTWRRQYRNARLISYLKTSFDLRKMLRQRKFDILINLTADKWWSIWLNNAPERIGLFPRPHAGLMGRLYTKVIERGQNPQLHNTRHYTLPAASLGIPGPYDEQMVVGVSDRHRDEVDQFLARHTAYDRRRRTIILHPGTSQISKCWLPEQFAELCDQVAGYNIVITGSRSERTLAEQIAFGRNAIVAAGELTQLGQTAALIERADAVVTGDTSILHIASALDTPLVGIYGSTRPGDNVPLFGRNELLYDDSVPCAPCYKSKCPLHGADHMRCIKSITVDSVMAALNRLGIEVNNSAAAHV